MKKNLHAFLLILVVLSCSMPMASASNPGVGQANDAQIARLAGLGKLWGYIKYTHPAMAYKTREWDQALVATIPKVKSATSAEEYGQAVDYMLSFLKDPATRRVTGSQQSGGTSRAPEANRKQPYIDWPDPATAVITVTDYQGLEDNSAGIDDLKRLVKEAAKAKAVIFDIRRMSQGSGYIANLGLTRALPLLIKGDVILPSVRFLTHRGYAPQTEPSFTYHSNLTTRSGGALRVEPGAAQRPAHLIFIVNAGSTDLYSLLSGMQDKGIASVVQEGDKNPDAGVTTSNSAQIASLRQLPDGVAVRVRRSEMVQANGITGFRPDVEVPASAGGQSDAAKQAALALAKKAPAARAQGQGKAQPVSPAVSFADDAYPQMTYPSEEYRLLALFRFWNAMEYFFPYKELTDQPWERALYDFIPRMQQARNATEYTLTAAELVARIQDSHGSIISQGYQDYMGTHRPPLRVDTVEGQTVVIHIDDSAKGSVDVREGDVVLAVDNEEITKRRERLGKYLPASNQGRLQYLMARQVLMGAKDSETVLKVRTRQGEVKEVKLKRTLEGAGPRTKPRKLPIYTVLPEGYGYVDFDRLTGDQVQAAYDAVKNTPGLILDMRGYPVGGSFGFVGAMAKKSGPAAMFNHIEYDGLSSFGSGFTKKQEIQPVMGRAGAGGGGYQGKVVVLIGEVSQSAAEHTCLMAESVGVDVTFMGMPTSGANGNITYAVLPGGIITRFTGMDVRHADGRQLQRVGVQPNIEVRPTVEGIGQGRDEVMERAISFLKGEPAASR